MHYNPAMQIHARHYRSGEPVCVDVVGDVIRAVTHSDRPAEELPLVAPGFFDPQINGFGGTWFSSETLTPHQVLEALHPHFGFGISRMFPTLITASTEALENGFVAIRRACEMEPWANELVAGVHLEGPYISGEDGPRGAHPPQFVREADWTEFDRLQQASGNRIRLVTLAPEVPGAVDFIGRAVSEGVTIAIGHTAANTAQIAAAADAGATMSTHLGNGAHPVLPRHPNYLWDQLADDRLTPSVIPDGFHLPASVLKCVLAIKGVENVVLTCDASGLAGCEPGAYEIHGVGVQVEPSKRISVSETPEILAGSAASTLDCVNHLVAAGIVSESDAIDMAGRRAAELTGLPAACLQPGQRADLVVYREASAEGLRVEGTMVAGAVRFTAS